MNFAIKNSESSKDILIKWGMSGFYCASDTYVVVDLSTKYYWTYNHTSYPSIVEVTLEDLNKLVTLHALGIVGKEVLKLVRSMS